jgi:hypothetical protein
MVKKYLPDSCIFFAVRESQYNESPHTYDNLGSVWGITSTEALNMVLSYCNFIILPFFFIKTSGMAIGRVSEHFAIALPFKI